MTKLFYHDYGTTIAVGISGDNEQEINEQFYLFWNHKATDGELTWMSNAPPFYFAYFWTDREKLNKAFLSMEIMRADWDSFKGEKRGFFGERGTREMGDKGLKRWASMTPEFFLRRESDVAADEGFFSYRVITNEAPDAREAFENLVDKANAS
jgi:hypothetical protein